MSKAKSKPISVSVKQAADLFGVTETTVLSWVRSGLPVLKRGRQGAGRRTLFDLAALIRWYLSDNPLDAARTRLASAQADKAEAENAVRSGELVEIAIVKREWSDLVQAFRAKHLAIPAKVSPQLVNIGNVSVIAARLTAAYAEASRELVDQTANDVRAARARRPAPRDGENRAPAAGLNGRRMGGSRTSTQ